MESTIALIKGRETKTIIVIDSLRLVTAKEAWIDCIEPERVVPDSTSMITAIINPINARMKYMDNIFIFINSFW